jgi:hypothetical protein
MTTARMLACATVAICFVAISAPARAQETWDETLKNTISSWWAAARNTARLAELSLFGRSTGNFRGVQHQKRESNQRRPSAKRL